MPLFVVFISSIKRPVVLGKRMFAIKNVRLYNNHKILKGGQSYGKQRSSRKMAIS